MICSRCKTRLVCPECDHEGQLWLRWGNDLECHCQCGRELVHKCKLETVTVKSTLGKR